MLAPNPDEMLKPFAWYLRVRAAGSEAGKALKLRPACGGLRRCQRPQRHGWLVGSLQFSKCCCGALQVQVPAEQTSAAGWCSKSRGASHGDFASNAAPVQALLMQQSAMACRARVRQGWSAELEALPWHAKPGQAGERDPSQECPHATITLQSNRHHTLITLHRAYLARRRAAAPATWGVAMEVPVK